MSLLPAGRPGVARDRDRRLGARTLLSLARCIVSRASGYPQYWEQGHSCPWRAVSGAGTMGFRSHGSKDTLVLVPEWEKSGTGVSLLPAGQPGVARDCVRGGDGTGVSLLPAGRPGVARDRDRRLGARTLLSLAWCIVSRASAYPQYWEQGHSCPWRAVSGAGTLLSLPQGQECPCSQWKSGTGVSLLPAGRPGVARDRVRGRDGTGVSLLPAGRPGVARDRARRRGPGVSSNRRRSWQASRVGERRVVEAPFARIAVAVGVDRECHVHHIISACHMRDIAG